MKISNLILPNTSLTHFDDFPKRDPRKLSRVLKLDSGIIEVWNNWVYIDDKWFYYKNFPNYKNPAANFINELIGEFLANLVGLESIKYSVGCMKSETGSINYGLLSEYFREKKYKYIAPADIFLDLNCIDLSNLEHIKRYCKEEAEYKNLVSQILKMIAIDVYTGQYDRSKNNFLFKKNKGSLSLGPLYDYEKAFFVDDSTWNNTKYKAYIFGLDIENKQELQKYPELYEQLATILSVGIDNILDNISSKHGLNMPDAIRNEYREYDAKRRALIKTKTKNI